VGIRPSCQRRGPDEDFPKGIKIIRTRGETTEGEGGEGGCGASIVLAASLLALWILPIRPAPSSYFRP